MDLPRDLTAVILDPHPLWLEAVERVLERIGARTVAKATVPEDAFALVQEHQPRVLVAELASPGDRLGGLACVQHVSETLADVRIIVLSGFEDQQSIQSAFAAGASAYVVKTAHPEDLATAVRQAFESSIFLLGESTSRDLGFGAIGRGNRSLTRREVEILRLTAQGYSNAELAKLLWVTEQTVKFHLSNIYRKLGVSNRTEASRWAQVNGVLQASGPPEPWGRPSLSRASSAN
jgi:DNA-binding NarL/FixJ family response regulator